MSERLREDLLRANARLLDAAARLLETLARIDSIEIAQFAEISGITRLRRCSWKT